MTNGQIENIEKGLVPPHSKEMEEAVIGALLVDATAIDEVIQVLPRADFFYYELNQKVYQSILDLYNLNQPIDILTVNNKYNAKYSGDDITFHLIGLSNQIGSSAHSEFHARIVLQDWIKREFIKLNSQAIAQCYKTGTDVFEIENNIEKSLDAIRETYKGSKQKISMVEATQMVVDRVDVLNKLDVGSITGVPTGFTRLDLITGGWQDSDLIIIAGRPGMGKSAICSATISACARQNKAVGVISLEMSTQQLATRLMANNSEFHLNQLFRHGFEKHKVNDYMPKLIRLKEQMQTWPVYFEDTPALDIKVVKSTARLWKRKHDIKLLIVDYLQLIRDTNKSGNREQEISSISQQLKAIAKELKIPVIALSQLSRSVETRGGDKIPQLQDLRESGAIEQDADLIAFLWRPGYSNMDVPHDLLSKGGNAAMFVKKHRNGSLDDIALYFDENKTKFKDPEVINNTVPY